MTDSQNGQAVVWDARARQFGLDLKTLAYGSKRTQNRKFTILTSSLPKERVTLLDVGCGFGDLKQFLADRGHHVDYYGVDISPGVVDLAIQGHPDRRIICADILHDTVFEGMSFDYVVSTGINCFNHGRNYDLEREMLRVMFDLCNREAIIGLQSAVSAWRQGEDESGKSWYTDPGDYLNHALRTLTPWANLVHDYMMHDFTLFLMKEPRFGI